MKNKRFFLQLFLFFLLWSGCDSISLAGDFHQLIRSGNLNEIRQAIADDSRLATLQDELGRSPLQIASEKGFLALVNVLINAGADVNHRDNLKGFTALHYAALHNHPRILKFLLARGADLRLQDNDGNFALHYCAANGCVETIEILLEHRADVNCMNNYWQTPLHLCAYAGKATNIAPYAAKKIQAYLRSAQILVQAGSYANLRDIYDDTPATIAQRLHPENSFAKDFIKITEYIR